jgi:hypothetical protein
VGVAAGAVAACVGIVRIHACAVGTPADLCRHCVAPCEAHRDVQEFHARYYHPSNARFWFYGDDAPEERLRLLAAYLDEFEAKPVDSTVHTQPLFNVCYCTCSTPQHLPCVEPNMRRHWPRFETNMLRQCCVLNGRIVIT